MSRGHVTCQNLDSYHTYEEDEDINYASSLVAAYVEFRSCGRLDSSFMVYDNDNVYTQIHIFNSFLMEVQHSF